MSMETAPSTARNPDGRAQPEGRLETRDRTETRRGFRTTEMYLAVITAAAVIVAAYASGTGSGSFPIRWGWLLGVIVMSAYVVSRGIAKAGQSEPIRRDDGRPNR